MTRAHRLRAAFGLTLAQLRYERTRTVLAVLGITVAVLSTTLLAGVGYGVLQTGEEKFAAADRDLWITGGPVRLAPGTVGGFENSILDAHSTARAIRSRQGIRSAVPMSFQTVYVGRTVGGLRTVVGVGVPGTGGDSVRLTSGEGFSRGDVHYGTGAYDGPMTREVIVDPRTAALFDVGVGDTLYVGGTIASARDNEYTVVGVSPTYSKFLGTPSVVVPLSELQELTGTTRTDRATLITVALREDADVDRVERELAAAYPDYDVRTNREQLEAVLADKIVILASGVTLVVLAVVSGLALTVNLLALLVYQQRRELAALSALGVSRGTLVSIVAGQGLVLGALGGAVGLALTPLGVWGLNVVAASVAGFEGLVRTPPIVFAVGGSIAVVMGVVGAAVAGWRVARVGVVDALRE